MTKTKRRAVAVEQTSLPPWMVKLLVAAILTALIGGGVGWINHTSSAVAALSVKTAEQAATQKGMEKDISEIKQDTREIKQLLTKRK